MISVVAPPGYGKTTVLSQYAEAAGRPLAWISVDRNDNDPVVLLTDIALTLDQVEPINPEIFHSLVSPAAAVVASVLPRLGSALSSMGQPITLVLDHVEQLEDPLCRDVVAELALRLPDGSQLAVAARDTPPIPAALLRDHGHLLEIGVGDLAMDEREVRALLEGAGYGGNLNAPTFIDFCRRLLNDAQGPVFLILDGHPVHRSGAVKQLAASTNGRLRLCFLPGYAPELNPDEWVWKHVKHDRIGRAGVSGPDDQGQGAGGAAPAAAASAPDQGLLPGPNLRYLAA